jgi:hypothetical protein
MRENPGTLRWTSRISAVEAFAQLNRTRSVTQRQVDRGYRLVRAAQAATVPADGRDRSGVGDLHATKGFMDDVPLPRVRFRNGSDLKSATRTRNHRAGQQEGVVEGHGKAAGGR